MLFRDLVLVEVVNTFYAFYGTQTQHNVYYHLMYEVCSNSIRVGIVVVVHWVGCVYNQT